MENPTRTTFRIGRGPTYHIDSKFPSYYYNPLCSGTLRLAFLTALYVSIFWHHQAAMTDKVFLDVEIDDKPAGRVIIGLYGDIVPRTTANFIGLCKGDPVRP